MKRHEFDIEDMKEEFRNSIIALSKLLKKTPTQKEYKLYKAKTINDNKVIYIYGSWSEAVKDAGLKPNPSDKPPSNKIDRELLIKDFIDVSNKIGKVPSMSEYNENSEYSWSPFVSEYKSWVKACQFIVTKHGDHFEFDLTDYLLRLSKKPKPKKKIIRLDNEQKKEIIRKELTQIAKKNKKSPTQREYKQEKTFFTDSQVLYLYNKWSNALSDAGLELTPIRKPPRPNKIEKDDLINEFVRVSNLIGKIPTMHQLRANSKYSWRPYETTWGSWSNSVKYIIRNYNDNFKFNPEIETVKKKEKKRKKLDYDCPLIYEPTNESETVVLFGLLADKMGFQIKKVQVDFPDAIIVENGKEILVEFEFLSSNFIQHGHDPDFDGLCICWRKDVELENIKTISLEEFIRKEKK